MSTNFERNLDKLRTELARQTEAVGREFPPHRPVAWERLLTAATRASANFHGWGGEAFATAGRQELHVGMASARLAEGDPRFPRAERVSLPDYLRERAATFRACLTFCGSPPYWTPGYVLRLLGKLEREDAAALREAQRLAALDPATLPK